MEKRKKRKLAEKLSFCPIFFNTFSEAILNVCKKEVNLNQKRNSRLSLRNFGHLAFIQ